MKSPDDVFEKIVVKTSYIWGPFYAIFYILRLLLKEMFGGRE